MSPFWSNDVKPNRFIVMTVSLAVFSVLGTTASIYSAVIVGPAWVRIAAGLAAIVILSLLLLLFVVLWPALRTNARGVCLIRAVGEVGISDLESRNEGDRHLPPEALYSWPGLHELLISGITGASSLRNHLGLVKQQLAKKSDVYFLVCSECTRGLDKISVTERRDLIGEVQEVRSVIEREGLLADERFHIRCFEYLPSFTAVMINGDLVPRQTPPQDSCGLVRVQPRRMESTHHEGVVLQFENTGRHLDGFNLFAADLRKQWDAAQPWN